MTTNDQAKRALELAVCNLLRPPSGQEAQPFFASLCMELTRVPVDADWFEARGLCLTACTDGRSLFYYPPFVNGLTPALTKSLLLHEVFHCALSHNTRRGERHPVRWNVACDYVVNAMIKGQCKSEVGADWLLDSKYDGMGAEAVYALLPEQPKGKGQGDAGDGNGSSQPGHVIDAATTGQDPAVVEKEWQVKLVNAAKCCGQGSVPEAFKHLIEEILNPTVPWQVLLRRFVQSVSQSDYSWSRPNKRFAWQKLFLPSLRSERVGKICFSIDVSGSTSDHWGAFIDEGQDCLSTVQPESLLWIQTDCAVTKRVEYLPGDTIERDIIGGGGSSSVPTFDLLAQEPEAPLVLCYLTDGWLEYPKEEPPYPVIWIMTTDVKPPFGEIIRMN